MSPEAVAEKVIILSSMGFADNNLEELVKKYNGNLELIVEMLLLNQGKSRGYHSDEPQQGRHGYCRRRREMSPEAVAEKVIILSSMGFTNNNLEELVKKYNGNLELIVEMLFLNQRNENINKGKDKERIIKEDNDMEVEEEGNANVFSYNL
jgi:hypothetical protein